jgi:NAD(P)-dependent dehydrogenase (short-subunit alcohol dehydrogenase family)|tara:strand:+ start:340 stop:1005 length:666 start_codon:yes stop_codon:yes gene_type:complete
MKIAVVTGSSRGIGREIAAGLKKAGLKVIGTQRTPSDNSDNDIALELSSRASIEHAAEKISGMVDHIDILVNNAAVLLDDEGQELNADMSDLLSETLKTNVVGTHLLTEHLLPLLRKSPDGARVINLSSLAGQLTSMDAFAPAYSISKTALNALTRQQAAHHRAEGITFNCMSPGWCRTEMGGPSAPRTPAEGAQTALWLALKAPSELSGKFFADNEEIPW